ncbi:MAG: hypothetical protein ACLTG0_09230 [Oscillibacter sp.]
MSDYIDILLTALEDELFPSLGKDYFLPLQQANDALTALSATLTDQQRALLDSYEDASAAAGSALSGRLRPQGPSSSRGRSTVKRPRRTAPRCCCR